MSRLWRAIKLTILLLVLPLGTGVAVGGFEAYSRSIPSVEDLRRDLAPPSTRIYADDGSLVGEIKLTKGKHVALSSLPRHAIDAVVALEDAHFWQHQGIDYLAIARAAFTDIKEGHLKQGGSTITQQLAKLTFLSSEKTFKRKIKEVLLAFRIEKNLSKEEIMELYLNKVYFGEGAYGIESASLTYFNKPSSRLSLQESALLAGLLKAPSYYSPFNNFSRAKERQETVLLRMEEEGYLDRAARVKAASVALVMAEASRENLTEQYFVDFVRTELLKMFDEDTLMKGGLNVHTTLDKKAQGSAQHALQLGLRELDKRLGFRGPIAHEDAASAKRGSRESFKLVPFAAGDLVRAMVMDVKPQEATLEAGNAMGTLSLKNAQWAQLYIRPGRKSAETIHNFNLTKILAPGDVIWVQALEKDPQGQWSFSLEQVPQVQGASVAVEPFSGYVRAVVGGYDYRLSTYNRAVSAKRQPGSAFKPFVYALALDSGYTPATTVVDEEISYTYAGKEWKPRNYDGKYQGAIRLRDALIQSRNVVTVKLVDTIGVGRVVRMARSVGFKGEIPWDLSIALGSFSTTPLEITAAYGTFANQGVFLEPTAIKYITDSTGKTIYSHRPTAKHVLDPQTNFLITSILRDVVRQGTGWRAKELGAPAAGKTGTTNDFRDAWFIGFTTDMVAGVWLGYDQPAPIGKEETGGKAATPIWTDLMAGILPQLDPKEFEMPDGIVTRLIDPGTGYLSNKWTQGPMLEYFKSGTEPEEKAPSIWKTKERKNLFF